MKKLIDKIASNTKFNNSLQIIYLAILVGLIFYLWNSTLLYPFKLLVIFFHETSHALATLLTGGTVKNLVVIQQQGGYVISEGGNRFIILNSGYLGSLIWGILIFTIAVYNKLNKIAMMSLAVIVGVITLLFVRNLFAVVFGLILTAVMLLTGYYLHVRITNFFLRLIGLTSMIYVPLDILYDTVYQSHLKSDARMLADEYGGAAMIWGMMWLIISAIMLFFCLKWSLKRTFKKKPEPLHMT